jgi:hypothetical protein
VKTTTTDRLVARKDYCALLCQMLDSRSIKTFLFFAMDDSPPRLLDKFREEPVNEDKQVPRFLVRTAEGLD